jgi:hypothetical protein
LTTRERRVVVKKVAKGAGCGEAIVYSVFQRYIKKAGTSYHVG